MLFDPTFSCINRPFVHFVLGIQCKCCHVLCKMRHKSRVLRSFFSKKISRSYTYARTPRQEDDFNVVWRARRPYDSNNVSLIHCGFGVLPNYGYFDVVLAVDNLTCSALYSTQKTPRVLCQTTPCIQSY